MSETKISVIIPLYNAEKFIRKCLISVLSSKFKDYEVLVVDDCSTDSSVAEAEKLLPHFEGRLKILSTEKNSGGPGIPRNVGIKNSAGKYITFVDNDDFLLPTALGDFFELAEKFSADVIHTEKCLIFNDKGDVNFTWNEISAQSDEPHDFFGCRGENVFAVIFCLKTKSNSRRYNIPRTWNFVSSACVWRKIICACRTLPTSTA